MNASRLATRSLVYVIGDEDTVTGLLLAGIGNHDSLNQSNYCIVDHRTTNMMLEETFHTFVGRKDIAILLINQHVAEKIRHVLECFQATEPFPAILEIPSKDHPYDPERDTIMKRVQKLFSAD